MTESRAAAAHRSAVFDHCVWPAEAHQLAAMRAEVRRWLAPFDLPDDTAHDMVLAVNEAAANAIEHAYSPGDPGGRVELAFWLAEGTLTITVADRGTWREPPVGPRGRGFGLPLMRRLVAAVGVEHDVHGTRVVLQHPLAGSNGHPDVARADDLEPASDEGSGRR